MSFFLFGDIKMPSDPSNTATSASIKSYQDSSGVSGTSNEDRNAKRRRREEWGERERRPSHTGDLHRRVDRKTYKKHLQKSHLAVRLDEVDAAPRVDLQARELAGLRPGVGFGCEVLKEAKERERQR